MFLMIVYLQGPRRLTPFNASLLYIPAYVLSGFISPFAGKLSDKFGARFIATLGLALEVGLQTCKVNLDRISLIQVSASFAKTYPPLHNTLDILDLQAESQPWSIDIKRCKL